MSVIDVNRKYIVDLPKRHKHIENNIFIVVPRGACLLQNVQFTRKSCINQFYILNVLSSRDFSVKNNFKISITIILKTSFLGREQHLP